MVRKKAAVCRVHPPVIGCKHGPCYEDLKNGDAFIFDGAIWMKCHCDEQEAIRLEDGAIKYDMCGKGGIIPVAIKVTWTPKK